MHGDHENDQRWLLGQHVFDELNPVRSRYGHVEQRHLGLVQPHDHERALRIGRLTAYSYVAELAQIMADSVPKDRMVVHHQQPFASRGVRW